MTVVEMKKGPKGGSPVDPESAERVERARAWLDDYRSKHEGKLEATWKAIARGVGYNVSSLTVFAGGNYSGSPLKIVEAIERWRELLDERQALVLTPGFVQTSVAKRLLTALRQTRTRGHMGIGASESGLGKTKSLKWFCASDPRAVFIMADPTLLRKGVYPFLIRLRMALGLGEGRRGSPAEAYLSIIEALQSSPKLLIFDEAQFLTREALDQIRCLHEAADVPIFFSGNEELYEGGLLTGMRPAAFTQFSSRVTVVEQIGRRDIRSADAVLVAAEMIGPDLAEELAEPLHAQTQRDGGFRALVTLLQRAHEIGRGRATEETILKAIAEQEKRRGGAR